MASTLDETLIMVRASGMKYSEWQQKETSMLLKSRENTDKELLKRRIAFKEKINAEKRSREDI